MKTENRKQKTESRKQKAENRNKPERGPALRLISALCFPNFHFGDFNEAELGDMILDFPGDAALPEVGSQRSEVRDLVFVVNGKPYVAKQLSDKLAQTWDVTVQGRQLFRTVLVRVTT